MKEKGQKRKPVGIDESGVFKPLRIAVLIMSDTRTLETDTSGAYLAEQIEVSGHSFLSREIIKDDMLGVRAKVQGLIDNPDVDVVITSGGTGLTGRDVTVEAVSPLIEKKIDGFSVLFHQISFKSIGLSTLQSRAFAGLSNRTLVFCLPGSTGAVRDGWAKIIAPQLDSRYRPCNFAGLVGRETS